MTVPDHGRFGNPFHWHDADEGCWTFIQIEPGLLVRFDPELEVDMLDARSEDHTICSPHDPQWHSIAECPNA